MRILVLYSVRNPSEESTKRVNALFSKWQPELQISEMNDFADGSGGMGIMETDDAALAYKMAAWATPYVDFTFKLLIPAEEGYAISQEAAAFWDSVS